MQLCCTVYDTLLHATKSHETLLHAILLHRVCLNVVCNIVALCMLTFHATCCMKVELCSTFVQQVAWNFQNTNISNCSKSRPQL